METTETPTERASRLGQMLRDAILAKGGDEELATEAGLRLEESLLAEEAAS